jgi:hypothetical protein
MAGKKGRSGRRKGSLSWFRNPVAVAGRHLEVLMEMWLAGTPIKVGPDRWLVQPIKRREGTVPPEIIRALAKIAIAQVMELQRQRQDAKPDTEARLRYQKALAEAEDEHRAKGWTDKKVAAWRARLDKHSAKKFYEPEIDKVVLYVRRRAPPVTLRFKKRQSHPDPREAAFAGWLAYLNDAWKQP